MERMGGKRTGQNMHRRDGEMGQWSKGDCCASLSPKFSLLTPNKGGLTELTSQGFPLTLYMCAMMCMCHGLDTYTSPYHTHSYMHTYTRNSNE